jgi:glycosyltransferase involved in cell wall biosynthesis
LARVLLATEGTYPYSQGGVSVWCDTLVRELSDVDYRVLAVATSPYVQSVFAFPTNVQDVQAFPLWGIRDPAENRRDMSFSTLLLRKQRTTAQAVERLFVPAFGTFLAGVLADEPDVSAMGEAVTAMHRYFQTYDYLLTWRSEATFSTFKAWLIEAVGHGRLPEPSVFDVVQGLGWLYHFLMVLDVPIAPDIELVHSSAAAFCGLVGVVAKLQYGIPYLLTEHGIYLREQYLAVGRSDMDPFGKRFLVGVVRAVVRLNYHHADRIAPVCAFNTRWERYLGAPSERIEVIYNGISPDVFAPAPAGAPPEPGRPVEVVSVARSDPNKDLETLLRAVAIARQSAPMRLRVFGSVTVPDYHARLLALRTELGLDAVVEFAGHTRDVARVYRDIVVQSSVSEAFPFALIEAMMSGAAVVATEVGGSAEAVGSAGLLVPARSPDALAEAIVTLAGDSGLRARLGEEARERALTLFHRARSIGQYRRAYRTLMRRRPRVAPARRTELLALERAMALDRAGHPLAALDQLHRALRTASGPSASAILAMISAQERRLGDARRADAHLVAAWLAQRLRRGPDRPAA